MEVNGWLNTDAALLLGKENTLDMILGRLRIWCDRRGAGKSSLLLLGIELWSSSLLPPTALTELCDMFCPYHEEMAVLNNA